MDNLPVHGLYYCLFNRNIDAVRRTICFALLALFVSVAQSQTYTDRLRQQGRSGEGKVVIIQDAAIEEIVNNVKKKNRQEVSKEKSETKKETPVAKNSTGQHKETETQERMPSSHTAGTRYRTKMVGYRIQIFTGGNSHNDKAHAFEFADKCRKSFPELSVYPRFVSPRWICRVGDFRTREDAVKYAGKIRSKRISTEVRIVKCEVLLPH